VSRASSARAKCLVSIVLTTVTPRQLALGMDAAWAMVAASVLMRTTADQTAFRENATLHYTEILVVRYAWRTALAAATVAVCMMVLVSASACLNQNPAMCVSPLPLVRTVPQNAVGKTSAVDTVAAWEIRLANAWITSRARHAVIAIPTNMARAAIMDVSGTRPAMVTAAATPTVLANALKCTLVNFASRAYPMLLVKAVAKSVLMGSLAMVMVVVDKRESVSAIRASLVRNVTCAHMEPLATDGARHSASGILHAMDMDDAVRISRSQGFQMELSPLQMLLLGQCVSVLKIMEGSSAIHAFLL
jgi:hypothetical protein